MFSELIQSEARLLLAAFCLLIGFGQEAFGTELTAGETESLTLLYDNFIKARGRRDVASAEFTQSGIQLQTDKALLAQLQNERADAKANYTRIQQQDLDYPEDGLGEQVNSRRAIYKQVSARVREQARKVKDQELKIVEQGSNLEHLEFNLQLSKERYEHLVSSLAIRYAQQKLQGALKPVVVETEATVFCGGDVTPNECRNSAKIKAERNALERGSIIVVEAITEVKNFQLSNDEVRSELRAQLYNQEILKDEPRVGQHFIQMTATVTPVMSANLRASISSSAAVEFRSYLHQIAPQIMYFPDFDVEVSPQEMQEKEASSANILPKKISTVGQDSSDFMPKAVEAAPKQNLVVKPSNSAVNSNKEKKSKRVLFGNF